jgi:O-antigen/teichoic acid export membrane protein
MERSGINVSATKTADNHVRVLTFLPAMLRSLLPKLSANTIQVFVNQGLSLLVFLLLARYLDKSAFGSLNLALAILFVIFGILSFGMDQLLVRKTAQGEPVSQWLSVVLFHYGVLGLAALIGLGLIAYFGGATPTQTILFALCAGKLAFSLSMPFKSIAIGEERFSRLLAMSVVANSVRVAGLALLWAGQTVTLMQACAVFVLADAAELLACVLLSRRHLAGFAGGFSLARYRAIGAESLPLVGTMVFSFALARFDWIFIGAVGTGSQLAEYSFAYKVFELSLLPLYVVAPLLLPRFTRAHGGGSGNGLIPVYQMEMIVAGATVFLLNGLWEPAANFLSDGKYGSVNTGTILALSVSIPLLYLNNFLWSFHFAAGRTRFILACFAACFLVDAGLTAVLVPVFGNVGAAVAYLVAIGVQTVLYYRRAGELRGLSVSPLLAGTAAALCGLWVARSMANPLGIFGGAAIFLLVLAGAHWQRVRKVTAPIVTGI